MSSATGHPTNRRSDSLSSLARSESSSQTVFKANKTNDTRFPFVLANCKCFDLLLWLMNGQQNECKWNDKTVEPAAATAKAEREVKTAAPPHGNNTKLKWSKREASGQQQEGGQKVEAKQRARIVVIIGQTIRIFRCWLCKLGWLLNFWAGSNRLYISHTFGGRLWICCCDKIGEKLWIYGLWLWSAAEIWSLCLVMRWNSSIESIRAYKLQIVKN